MSGSSSSPQRANSRLVYDPEAKKVLLFGGDALDHLLADTWAFDVAAYDFRTGEAKWLGAAGTGAAAAPSATAPRRSFPTASRTTGPWSTTPPRRKAGGGSP
ncbi:MAG TPA: hypothetical protein VFW33_21470 [Gemmataceae bacterium]|nr:hypothetical protein [Gemmataceae bacterium]